MKKKLLFLILLLIPFIVKAADVSIESAELIENNTKVDQVQKPAISGLNLDFRLKFNKLNESVKYKVIIVNNSKKDYEIENTTKFGDKEYIKYNLVYPSNSKVLKANTKEELIITITYNKEVPFELFNNGVYIDNNNLSLDFITNQTNPTTKVGLPLIIMITVASISFIFIIVMSIKKHSLAMFIIALAIIPLTAYALEKITINVKATVEITTNEDIFEIGVYGCSSARNGKYYIRYQKGMTFPEFYESSYFNAIDPDLKIDLHNEPVPNFYNREVQVCLNDSEFNPGDMSRFYDCTSGHHYEYNFEEDAIINENQGMYVIHLDC